MLKTSKTAVDAGSFDYLEELGSGSFGKVHKVVHRDSQEICAMKLLARERVEKGNLMKYVLAERNAMCKSEHPFIVGMRYAFQTDKQFVLVMQYCPGGDLQALIKSEKKLSAPLTKHYAGEVLLALEYLHEKRILHRDLKPENVLLDGEDHAVLTDFGLAKVTKHNMSTSFCGSIAYLAPEMLKRTGHKHTVDIYGLGVLIFTMLTGQIPFYNKDKNVMWEAIKGAELVIPKKMPSDASSLIKKLMHKEPHQRLGASKTAEIQKHAFFKSLDFTALYDRTVPVPKPTSRDSFWNSRNSRSTFFDSGAETEHSHERSEAQKKELFGPQKPWARVFNCFRGRPVNGFDYRPEVRNKPAPPRQGTNRSAASLDGPAASFDTVRRGASVPRRDTSTGTLRSQNSSQALPPPRAGSRPARSSSERSLPERAPSQPKLIVRRSSAPVEEREERDESEPLLPARLERRVSAPLNVSAQPPPPTTRSRISSTGSSGALGMLPKTLKEIRRSLSYEVNS